MSQALRPVALEQVGVTAALEAMAHQASESSTAAFSVEIEDIDGLLPKQLEINLYRIVQEGLNNVLKHADAGRVVLEVKRLPDRLSVSLFDDGIGFDLNGRQNGGDTRQGKASLGLVSMTERAKLLGGSLDIKSTQGTGTRLTLPFPWSRFLMEASKPTRSPANGNVARVKRGSLWSTRPGS